MYINLIALTSCDIHGASSEKQLAGLRKKKAALPVWSQLEIQFTVFMLDAALLVYYIKRTEQRVRL